MFVTSERRSETMRAIRSQGTRPERLLGSAMFSIGLRYRKSKQGIPGRPDFAFCRPRVAVFVDGSFWHGYNWSKKRECIAANREYWIPKIEGNIGRDSRVNESLRCLGWTVLRFWDFQVLSDADECALSVKSVLGEKTRHEKK